MSRRTFDAEEILETVRGSQEQLTPGAAVLFERLSEGETETTPEELVEEAEEQESEVAQLDLLAAAGLLNALDRE